MDVLKKEILALTQEQQSHVHTIIGDDKCTRTANGVRFNLHKLSDDTIDAIRAYIAAIGKHMAAPLRIEVTSEPSIPGRKKVLMSKHQALVKKRLRARCRQRKVPKQDKSNSKIDFAVASEFCEALKGDDGDQAEGDQEGDGDEDELVTIEPEIEDRVGEDEEEDDDLHDNNEPGDHVDDVCEDESIQALPPHLSAFSHEELMEYFLVYLRGRGLMC